VQDSLSRPLGRRGLMLAIAASASKIIPGLVASGEAVVRSGGGTLDLHFPDQEFDLPRPAIVEWVKKCADAVSVWLGHFPVESGRIRIDVTDREERGVPMAPVGVAKWLSAESRWDGAPMPAISTATGF